MKSGDISTLYMYDYPGFCPELFEWWLLRCVLLHECVMSGGENCLSSGKKRLRGG